MSDDDRYLWDRSGEPDPEVERLERLLSPLAHRANTAPPVVDAGGFVPRPWLRYAAAAAAVVAVGAGAWIVTRPAPEAPPEVPTAEAPNGAGVPATSNPPSPVPPTPSDPLPGGEFRVVAGGADVAPGSWIRATDGPRDVTLGDVARLRLDAGSRLRVDRAGWGLTLLFLERGSLEARVSADAKPRFFRVDTYAARCVDLGCHYTLSVDDAGVSRVRVTTGQVSFESGEREVYVPAGAGCQARPGAGTATPRFDDASEDLAKALDAFDAVDAPGASAGVDPERRRELARRAFAAMRSPRDTLAALDMLQDADDSVAVASRAAIVRLAGRPEDLPLASTSRPTPQERERWKAYLERLWR